MSIEPRNDYGFPAWPACTYGTQWTLEEIEELRIARLAAPAPFQFNRIPRQPTKLERAQAYAADVRARRGMLVRKGYYVDLKD